jgi:hypothetical protein
MYYRGFICALVESPEDGRVVVDSRRGRNDDHKIDVVAVEYAVPLEPVLTLARSGPLSADDHVVLFVGPLHGEDLERIANARNSSGRIPDRCLPRTEP